MDTPQAFMPWRRMRRLVNPPLRMRRTYPMEDLAWAQAWPRVDDWFKIESARASRITLPVVR